MFFRALFTFEKNQIIPLLVITFISIILNIKRKKNEQFLALFGDMLFQLTFLYSLLILIYGFNSLAKAYENDKPLIVIISISTFLSINVKAGTINLIAKTINQLKLWLSNK